MSGGGLSVTELFVNSITEHAASKHLQDLRNEDRKGNQLSPSRSKGEPLSAFDKEDFRQHLRQTLSDPNTKYFIDESNGRITFFNENETNRSRIVFNPAQFETDGHAGTKMRQNLKEGNKEFLKSIDKATENMGRAPEIRSVSDGGWIEHLEKYRVQLENVPDRVLGKGDLRTDYARAGDNVKIEPLKPLDYSEPNSPKMDSPLKRSFNVMSEAAGPVLKKLGYAALGAVPIIGYLGNSAEASELKADLQEAIDQGDISPDAVLAYSAIMEAHKIQGGFDPTIFGEIGIQAAYNDWANNFNVNDEWRERLEPSSIGKMMLEGTLYIGENGHKLPKATIEVGQFAAEQTISGISSLANGAAQRVYQLYDNLSGNTLAMQAVYKQLPVLDPEADNVLYDHTQADNNPVYNYPVAHDLALIKSQIVASENTINALDNGTKQPLDGMNRGENIEFLQGRVERLNDSFESTFEQAQQDGSIAEVEEYVKLHGAQNIEGTPALAVAQSTKQPAINQNFILPGVAGP
ncbi:MAG: hypothetical protein OEY94_05055 [Alphaproteobacteria bacterium]|nr:hypothetical protein [Alphaproteobacteria bacterium]